MNKRLLLILAVIAIAVAIVLGLRAYSAAVPHAAGRDADVTLSATELFGAFQSDEQAANARYNDKVVRVHGVVRSVEAGPDGRSTVVLATDDVLGGVVCEFPAGAVHDCQVGSTATIQGFCSGFNLDVLLQRCSTVGRAS